MVKTKAKVTKAKVVETGEIARDLRPKDLFGLKGHGPEPRITEQPESQKRDSVLGRAFNWYNYFCTNKESKQFMVEYLIALGDTTRAKQLNKVPDSKIKSTYGWMARLSARGLILTDEEKSRFDTEMARLFDLDQEPEIDIEVTEANEEAARKNIQEVMRERASDVAGDLEGLLDEYIRKGCKGMIESNKVINPLSEKKILPQHISIILNPWLAHKAEFEEVLEDKDELLTEGYSHLTKAQVKHLVKAVDQVIKDINSYVSLKKVTKAKRARKPVSVEKQVAKLKYMRKFKDDKMGLDLVSIDPTKLHNSTEAWCYDTAKRKLYHYVADELSKTLIVKGNTVLGFDTKESEAKTLRKPNEAIKQIMGSKPGARKHFKDIKAVSTTPNGRFNPNIIILRAF
jgi:hypothetical protein